MITKYLMNKYGSAERVHMILQKAVGDYYVDEYDGVRQKLCLALKKYRD